jgi:hypothetical protein
VLASGGRGEQGEYSGSDGGVVVITTGRRYVDAGSKPVSVLINHYKKPETLSAAQNVFKLPQQLLDM